MPAADPATPVPCRFSIQPPWPLWIWLAAGVLVVVGVGLRIGGPIYRQQVAIREIERLGGTVQTRSSGPEWLRKWVGDGWMKPLDNVIGVSLLNTEATDDGMAHLTGLTNLERLSLAGTRVTVFGVVSLRPAFPNHASPTLVVSGLPLP